MASKRLKQVFVLLFFVFLLPSVVIGSRFLFVSWLGERAEQLAILMGLLVMAATWAWVASKIWSPKKASKIPDVAPPCPVMCLRCLDCSSEMFFVGPSGGLCTNYKCAVCGSEYNVGPGFMERIRRR